MKRVLIVTPNWPPVTYPDMHRARMALPYLKDEGWEPLILHTNPDEQGGAKEPALSSTIPAGTRTWQAEALPRFWTLPLGLTHVGWRSLRSLYTTGCRIIEEEKPELVFFSTTMFPVMMLGPLWKKKYGLRYALDFQDPWVREPGDRAASIPGLRNWISRTMDQWMERRVVAESSHVISVSAAYVKTLSERYRDLKPLSSTVLPFGAPDADFAMVQKMAITQSVYRPDDGWRHWAYVGRGGVDLEFSLKAFFRAVAEARRMAPVTWNRLRLHFIGTHYAPSRAASKPIERLAAESGVGDLVEEKTERIGYLESLRCLTDAEALIVPGSDEGGYTASKLYPYILAKKPLLAIFHERSAVCEVIRQTRAGELITFSGRESVESVSAQILQQWFQRSSLPAPATDWSAFSQYSAREMTRRMGQAFNQAWQEARS